MKYYVKMNSDEINELVPYALVCSSMYGSKWDTGSVKRKFRSVFSEKERIKIRKIKRDSHNMYLGKGVPQTMKMSLETLALWHKLANFCSCYC